MTTNRRYLSSDAFPYRKDADGKPLCRWCGGAVKPPRRSWCSQECVDAFLIQSDGNALRDHVFRRDGGICAKCGCDTGKLQRILDHAIASQEELGTPPEYAVFGWWTQRVWAFFTRLGFNEGCSLWEADHVVEVCNGGATALDNMQTLCVPCHKEKTRQMHANRKQARTGIAPRPPVQEVQLELLAHRVGAEQ